ncbi:MAG: hypothetical protein M3R36_11405 [Bacteroidota bacterium]|nr:hypothetical protein [Bacteroidota bacterium]
MKTITKKKRTVSNKNIKDSSNQSKLLDKDILKAVQIQDSMRKKYKGDKDWNSVNVIRKFRYGI